MLDRSRLPFRLHERLHPALDLGEAVVSNLVLPSDPAEITEIEIGIEVVVVMIDAENLEPLHPKRRLRKRVEIGIERNRKIYSKLVTIN